MRGAATSQTPRTPRDFEVLARLGQIRALAQRERLEVLRFFIRQPGTCASAAAALGLPSNRVHYHLRRLLAEGLLIETGRGRKRWKEERWYTASARHFLIDPAVGCDNGEASASMLRAAELSFLHWRRREVLNIDLGALARKAVCDCLRVRLGERVLVMFQPPALELAEASIVEIEALGATAIPKLWSRNFLVRTLERHDESALAALPFLGPEEDERLAAVLYFSASIPQGPPPPPELMRKLPLVLESVSRWQRSLHERGIRYLEVNLPHRQAFEGATTSPEFALDTYWRCLDADYGALASRMQRILSTVSCEGPVTISDDHGNELVVHVDHTRPIPGDGVLDEEDLAAGRTFDTLPAGSLSFLPLPGSGEGTFLADRTFIGGVHPERIHVTLREGRIIAIEAAEGEALLRERLASAAGDAGLISQVGIGLNPAARELTGSPALDARLEGVVSIAFGNNELHGGSVRSTLDLVLPTTRCTLRVGERALVDRGKLGPPGARAANGW